jgi:glycosyltransferase involved in cell wall biosynthesis
MCKRLESDSPLASIVMSSYNYARYLPQAIDSTLAQTYRPLEIIVVDDGSTDQSPDIIRSYGDQVMAIFKANGGQASAWNAGYARSKGCALFFMDSDDLLLPTAVERAMERFVDPLVVKVHWHAWEIDAEGRISKEPGFMQLEEGNLRGQLLAEGPYGYVWPPTTQNAWRRSFLELVMPMPESEYRISPDLYLAALVPLYGNIALLSEPQSFWRGHGVNASYQNTFEDRLRAGLERDDLCLKTLARHCAKLGLAAERDKWEKQMWYRQIDLAIKDIDQVIPPGQSFILVDQDEWACGQEIKGRHCVPFPEKDGLYWGYPESDAVGIAEVERVRAKGVGFMVFAWPHMWWREYYTELTEYLERSCKRLLANDRVAIYDMR